MSGENLEKVRFLYEGWSKGDLSVGADLFDPNVEFASYMPDSNEKVTARGTRGIAAFVRGLLEQFSDYRLEADEIRALGDDAVLVKGHQTGVGRLSGVAVEDWEIFSVWHFRGGKVIGLYFARDEEEAIEAAGLSQ